MNSEIREHEARRPGGALIAKTQVFVSGCGHIRIFTVIGAGYELKADVFKYVKSLTDTLNSYKLKPEALEAVSDLMKVYIGAPLNIEGSEPIEYSDLVALYGDNIRIIAESISTDLKLGVFSEGE